MLKSKFILKEINRYNHYRYKQYNCEVGDTIKIPVEDLPIHSHVRVDVMCDNCGKEYDLKYQAYNVMTNNNTEKMFCSKKECINIKRNIVVEDNTITIA